MPGQINYLKAKADALLLLGNDTAAVEVQKTILDIDYLNFDANLFLGSYYAIKGQEKLKSIDQQYLEDSNGLSISASVYKEEKRQVIDDDIACAKNILRLLHGFVAINIFRNNFPCCRDFPMSCLKAAGLFVRS